jgi:hypothetical protein
MQQAGLLLLQLAFTLLPVANRVSVLAEGMPTRKLRSENQEIVVLSSGIYQ